MHTSITLRTWQRLKALNSDHEDCTDDGLARRPGTLPHATMGIAKDYEPSTASSCYRDTSLGFRGPKILIVKP
jgi:hypothetical protein